MPSHGVVECLAAGEAAPPPEVQIGSLTITLNQTHFFLHKTGELKQGSQSAHLKRRRHAQYQTWDDQLLSENYTVKTGSQTGSSLSQFLLMKKKCAKRGCTL